MERTLPAYAVAKLSLPRQKVLLTRIFTRQEFAVGPSNLTFLRFAEKATLTF
jgi:hypothetical protein